MLCGSKAKRLVGESKKERQIPARMRIGKRLGVRPTVQTNTVGAIVAVADATAAQQSVLISTLPDPELTGEEHFVDRLQA